MKVAKFFSIVLAGSFLTVSSMMASGNENADVKKAENTVREQIANVLSDVNIESSDVIYVYFTVSSKGFELIDAKGENTELSDKVKEALSTSSIVPPVALEGKYLIKVRFVTK
jgi:hypothetical protein